MHPDRAPSLPAVGGSSLLVIFGVLCLTVFSLLTLTTAQAFKRLSDAGARTVQRYYEAELQAETVFAQLRSGAVPEAVSREGNLYRYSVPISQHQQLYVLLEQNNGWQVLCWQTQVCEEPEAQETASLWDGNTLREDTYDQLD